MIGAQQENITYRFVSDFPFQNRAAHQLDKFEKDALDALREDPEQKIVETETSLFSDKVRLVAPVTMGPACVSCHNSHPESPKKDWKVGDVRGIQEVIIAQPIAANIFSFKFLLAYFLIAAGCGLSFLSLQRRQAGRIKGMNKELESANDFLASLSMKISRYIPPQVYKSIFSGQKDVTIHTERKKLTIFFSDIQNFTATAERLQPELLTQLLNEYFTEMSAIAHEYGGTIDKFIGDAMLIFFGDPETKGDRADAQACLQMAWRMQHRLAELNAKWRASGIEQPFRLAHGHQFRLLQCRQFRQQRPHGLHHHRRRSEPRRAPAIDRRARRHRAELRDLCAGQRHRPRPRAARDHDEGHQPRDHSLFGRRAQRRGGGEERDHHRARAGARALSRPRRGEVRRCRTGPLAAGKRAGLAEAGVRVRDLRASSDRESRADPSP